jgi:glyoxylase-like metal-dependent hydrolase (beta-lactamase superfamily II)
MTTLSRRSLLAGTTAAAAVLGTGTVLPSKAAAPAVGKQAAGWYRMKVGEFEVTIVTDGGNAGAIADGYVANASKADINTVLAAEFRPADRSYGVYTPTVINTGSKLVAIDTGLGMGMYQQSKGAVGQYHTNLKAAGIDANQVDVVIISHFHGDHINGLVGADNKPAFPNAEIMVPAVEWAFWSDESNASKLPAPARGQIGNVKRVFGALGNKVTQYEAGKELVPGITAVATPGHTPGHTSHLITSGNGKLLVQADVTAGMATLFVRNPDWQFMFDTDKAQAVQTRKKIYDMASADKLLVQGYHFTFPSLAYVEKAGSGYRLVPAPWSPVL